MKINSINWQKNKKRTLFFLWPMALSSVITVFLPPFIDGSSVLAWLMPFLGLIVWVPFVIVDMLRYKAETEREKREMQARYDAEDKAMFGKPLREFEL